MKTHFFWFIYVITLVCAGGWYILEQKDTISKQEKTIRELTVSQRPPIVPEKRKVQVVEKEIDKKAVCSDILKAYKNLEQKTLQCAYNLKFCQEASDVYSRMKPTGKQDGDKN